MRCSEAPRMARVERSCPVAVIWWRGLCSPYLVDALLLGDGAGSLFMPTHEHAEFTAAFEALLKAHTNLHLAIFDGDEYKPDSECVEEMKAALVKSIQDVVAKGRVIAPEMAEVINEFAEALEVVSPGIWD